jgi:hypothetical protein
MLDAIPTTNIEHMPLFARTKEFDVLRIDYQMPDFERVQEIAKEVVWEHTLIEKDGYKNYDAIGLQYANEANPLYDAVQQTTLKNKGRFLELNEIGDRFQFVYDQLMQHGISLERGRILRAKPSHVHAKHVDNDIRIHLPILTNESCKMIYENNEYHMAANGYIYLINGFRRHHFYNRGQSTRTHMVWLVQPELFT